MAKQPKISRDDLARLSEDELKEYIKHGYLAKKKKDEQTTYRVVETYGAGADWQYVRPYPIPMSEIEAFARIEIVDDVI